MPKSSCLASDTPHHDQEADRLETRGGRDSVPIFCDSDRSIPLIFDPRQTHPACGQQIAFLQLPRLYLWIPENRSKSNWRHKSWVLFLFLQEKLVNKSSYKSAVSWFFSSSVQVAPSPGWIPIVHCGRPFNAVIKPLLSNIKYCRHCWWTSWYCWSS